MNILIKDINVVTMNEKNEVLKNTNIYIKDKIIKYIGKIKEDIKPEKIIDGKHKLLMPGLINAHTHLGMSLLRNYADDLPLHEWLTSKIWPIEGKMKEEDIYWGSLLSMVEMIQGGTTSFSDMYDFMDKVALGVEESGMRGVLARGMIEEPGKNEIKLNEAKKLYENWNNKADGRIKIMLAPHAPYTCGKEFLQETIKLAKELNTGIHTHLSETKKELNDSLELHGKTPIEYVRDLGMFEVHTIGAHCVYLKDRDIEIIRDENIYPVNNPGSNLKLASGFARVEEMINSGIPVSLGTDGSSSNNNLNMFEEINLAALINKAVNSSATSIPAEIALKMATLNGAKALEWEDEIGSIEVGKKADMILIDVDKAHFYPHHNIISSLAYTAQASDVDTVIIDGKIIMEKREIKTLDVEKIKFETDRLAKDLIKR